WVGAQPNVISGNLSANIQIQDDATNNKVANDYIGSDANGLNRVGGAFGVVLHSANYNNIGVLTTSAGNVLLGKGNVISGNEIGVQIDGGAYGNSVEGNYIGTDKSGTAALANRIGVTILNSPNNTIRGPMPFSFASPQIEDGPANVISGNSEDGIQIKGPGATGNLLESNRIGIPLNGGSALGNGFSGVSIADASGNTIGGLGGDKGNFIAGDKQNGILIRSLDLGPEATARNQVEGNYIGIDPRLIGTTGNAADGVVIYQAQNNTITANTVSDNLRNGVDIDGATATGNSIGGNRIGISPVDDSPLGNGLDGVLINKAQS